MRVFVPQPIHGGFLSQMLFLFPDIDWVLEGDQYIWKPNQASKLPIDSLFKLDKLNYCNKSLTDVDLKQFDVILAVVETHYNSNKLRTTNKPIVWRNYYSILRGNTFNGPISYAAHCVKKLSATPGEVIYETRDPDFFNGWSGERECVVAVASNLKDRHAACGGPLLDKIKEHVSTTIITNGSSTRNELRDLYRKCRVYVDAAADVRRLSYARVFSGSFIESMMCGTPPVVTNTNEFGMIIENGIDGFKCTSYDEMITKIKRLIGDYNMARKISTATRAKALAIYNPKSIRKQWKLIFQKAKA